MNGVEQRRPDPVRTKARRAVADAYIEDTGAGGVLDGGHNGLLLNGGGLLEAPGVDVGLGEEREHVAAEGPHDARGDEQHDQTGDEALAQLGEVIPQAHRRVVIALFLGIFRSRNVRAHVISPALCTAGSSSAALASSEEGGSGSGASSASAP